MTLVYNVDYYLFAAEEPSWQILIY